MQNARTPSSVRVRCLRGGNSDPPAPRVLSMHPLDCLQILKRRAAQEAAIKRARHKGRRVSFAPDEDLVTTQLYALVG